MVTAATVTVSRELFDLYESNANWFYDNYAKFREKYKNKWVLINHEEIQLSAKNIEELEKGIEEKKIDLSVSVIKFIPKKEILLVL